MKEALYYGACDWNKVMPNSMTGFAREEAQFPWGNCSCEIRSINHRYLEIQIRLPEILGSLEESFRDLVRSSLSRGKVEVCIQLNMATAQTSELNINICLVKQLVKALEQIESTLANVRALDPFSLLQWPGVIEKNAFNVNDITDVVAAIFAETLSKLIEHRQREGRQLTTMIAQRLATVVQELAVSRAAMPIILKNQHEKLQQRLQTLTTVLNAERLEQEAVLLANKANIDEELDRLEAHVKEVNHILGQSGPVGRRLDFMMQEFNREANTLSSKSLTTETTQIAVSLKVLIEQMREQIQNIE
jgi:uncharacterized protein (TIGR00255 family)